MAKVGMIQGSEFSVEHGYGDVMVVGGGISGIQAFLDLDNVEPALRLAQ